MARTSRKEPASAERKTKTVRKLKQPKPVSKQASYSVSLGAEQTCILSVLSGQPLSELPKTSDISADDLFFVGRVDSSGHHDFYMTYADLSSRVFADIRDRLGLSSMAFRDEWEYARINHSHDYSKVRCYARVQSSDICNDRTVDPRSLPEWIASVSVWMPFDGEYKPEVTDIYMPHVEQPVYVEPPVGETRFLARNSYPAAVTVGGVDMVYDSELSGYWAYPDGSTVACASNEFVSACKVYGVNGKTGYETSFRLPALSGFMKLNPAADTAVPMRIVPFQNGLPSHTHQVDNNSIKADDIRLEFNLKVDTNTEGVGAGESISQNSLHSGSGAPCSGCKLDSTMLTAELGNVNLTQNPYITDQSALSLDIETRPMHVKLPVLVYIGRKQ